MPVLSWRGKSLQPQHMGSGSSQNSPLRSLVTELFNRPVSLFGLLSFFVGYSLLLVGLTASATTMKECMFRTCESPPVVAITSSMAPGCFSARDPNGGDPFDVEGSRRKDVLVGNADRDVMMTRNKWILGHFFADQTGRKEASALASASSLRTSRNVELKWARNQAGTRNNDVAVNKHGYSMGILFYGAQRYEFGDQRVLLTKTGDYVIWAPGVPHTWTSERDSLILTVRWPSLPGDQSAVAGAPPAALANNRNSTSTTHNNAITKRATKPN
mmetsp:Transcript_10991/g.23533  ORF Transcript_10991/g.23533 Transcript_10991/m.23533 type:complete len:272 (+) Transcript_10991:617-1432(+)